MKLKKLTIENIASIEHAEIDFSASPLKDEHLFLITGPTGSGKSTIIDCLCLALYGTTPRLESAKKREGSYEDVSNNGVIKAYESKQLLRRGTVSASVTLTFDDNQGIPYTATWQVRRAHKSLDNNIMTPERTLRTDEGIVPAVDMHKVTEINNHITELIGLNMNEFFRTVVLAQGKFAEFLNSNENEKSTLLEKMTGTEIFTQVGKKIFEVFRDKENRRNNLQTQLNEITLLNDEQKASINDEIGQLNEQQATIQQQRDGAKKMTDWLDEKEQNERNLAQKQQDLACHEERTREAGFVAQQQLVIDWEATIEVRREMRDMVQAQQRLETLQQQQPAMQDEFDRLCAALRATIHNVEEKRKKVDEIGTFLKQEAPNSAMYDAIKTIKAHMKQRQGELDNINAFTLALEKERQRLPQVEAQVKSSLEARNGQDAKVQQLQAQYDSIKVDQVNARKDAVTEAKQALILYKAKLDAVVHEADTILKMQTDAAHEQQNLDKENAVIDAKRALKEQAREALEREKDWNALIEQAHKSLREGDTCPVCGNRISNLQAPKGKNVLDELKQRLKEAEDNLQASETAIAATTKAIQRLKHDIADHISAQANKQNDCGRHWSYTRELLARCGKNTDETADATQADALIESLNKDLDSINATLQQATELFNQITAERNKLTQLTNDHNKAQIDLNKVGDSIKYQEEAITRSKAKFAEFTAELDELLTMSDWQEAVAQNAGFIDELEQRANTYQLQVKTAQQLENEIQVANAIIPAMQENKSNITRLVDNGKDSDNVPRNLDELWRQFENKHINWSNQLDNEQNIAQRAQHALDKYIAEHPSTTMERLTEIDRHGQGDIANIKRAQQELAELITHTKGELTSLKSQKDEIAAKKPDFIEQDREQLSRILVDSQAQLEQLANQIADRRAQLMNDEENRKTAGKKQEEFEAADAEYQQWYEFNTMLGDSNGTTFRKIAQSYILGELLHCANGYLRQFNTRYTLEAKPGTLTILVRDQLQGDITTVNTLSGGEGFMVSLALALALSSTTGKIFSVDTLFIDEGFGSLSGDYLEKVMDTLNRLYNMGGKRVGIISHVEALQGRVTTQIQVTRDQKNNTVSRVTVV